MIPTIIIEDNEVALAYLRQQLLSSGRINLIGEFETCLTALNSDVLEKAQLIFLDIETPELDGMEFLERLQSNHQIIIVSSKKEYALKSYEFNVTDYLIKPVLQQRLLESLDRAFYNIESLKEAQPSAELITVKTSKGEKKLRLGDILYIRAMADYVRIHTESERLTVHSSLNSMEDKLSSFGFIRCHRSFLVNLRKISLMTYGKLEINKIQIPISRKYQKIVRETYRSL